MTAPSGAPQGAGRMAPAGTAAAAAPRWRDELGGGVGGAVALLPFALSYGFIVFGVIGAPAAQIGLSASVVAVVIGALAMVLFSRATLPAAAPSASNCLILGACVVRLTQDPALLPTAPGGAALMLAAIGVTVVAAGSLQWMLGALRAGNLVRFVPQPVLAGFMNGVAILIVWSQIPPLLGLPADALARDGARALAQGQWPPLAVAAGTAALVWALGRRWPRAPAPLLALMLAAAAVLALQAASGGAWAAALPPVGRLAAELPGLERLQVLAGPAAGALLQRHGGDIAITALLLALIGGLESVLALTAVDQLLNTRTDANRELRALGAANIVSGLLGGLPVIYQRLLALSVAKGGGRSWRAVAASCGLLALAFTLGLPLMERLPKAVVAGIVVMLAWSLVDRWTRQLVAQWRAGGREADRQLSLAVVFVVCAITLAWGFPAGVGAGVLVSMAIFMRALNRSLVRARFSAADIPSRRVYPAALQPALDAARRRIEVLELEGALFFGNIDRLTREAEALAPGVTCLVIDLRRVSTLDASAAVNLALLDERLARRGTTLMLAGVTPGNRHGRALQAQGADLGSGRWQLHPDADRATEAAEKALLDADARAAVGAPVAVGRCALFEGLDERQRALLQALLTERRLKAGERLFVQGDPGHALYLLSAGSVSVVDHGGSQRFASFSPSMCFGETAVLDGGGRTADAVADVDSTVHELTVARLQALQHEHPDVAAQVYRNLALHLSQRLRSAAAWRRAAA